MWSDSGIYGYYILKNVSGTLICIVLGLTFWKLTAINKQMEGIFCDARLMLIHYIAFVAATFFGVVSTVL